MTWAIGQVFRGGPRVVLLIAALIGVLASVGLAAALPPAERTFATVCGTSQLLMSAALPFSGVLLVCRLERPTAPRRAVLAIVAAVVVAVLIAALGVVLAAAVTGQFVGAMALGSAMVQITAQLTGTGFGLLLRHRVLACAATVVPPLAVWWLLGTVPVLRPAQSWLSPFGAAQPLLAGALTVTTFAQWLVVLLLWGLLLNALAVRTSSQDNSVR